MLLKIKGARVNNLKNIDLNIPHGKLIVITGVSGSGKTSLAFDTIFAEGQRRFIESMSSYVRQFLGKLEKPDVDFIHGIAPTIAIQQKTISSNPRSTVGTVTEIYDYLKLLYARCGETISPISNTVVKKHTAQDVYNFMCNLTEDSRIALVCSISLTQNNLKKELDQLKKIGFTRILVDNVFIEIEELDTKHLKNNLLLVVDRFIVDKNFRENRSRLLDSIETTFSQGSGSCAVFDAKKNHLQWFNNRFELDDMVFTEPSNHFFTFNNPYGACKTCEGFGMILGIDEDLVIPDKSLSVFEGAIAPWKGESMKEYLDALLLNAVSFDFPIHRPIEKLSEEEYQLLWKGNSYFTGLHKFFAYLERKSYKIQYRVLLSRYRGKTLCTECKGTRLRGDANYVKINGKSLQDIVLTQVKELIPFFKNLTLKPEQFNLIKMILPEILSRLEFLDYVGLNYLTLNRSANTLSGGESQRINLATSLGSTLKGSIYILDEPSVGLHASDNKKLIEILLKLRDEGNTVLVVEHDEEIMKACDLVIDIGPQAGMHGGTVVFQGEYQNLLQANSLTADYLSNRRKISKTESQKLKGKKISISGANQYNLKNISVDIPLNSLVAISGISGSGKSTLVKSILYPALKRKLGLGADPHGKFKELTGDISSLKSVEFVDQNPIGRSSRSNPATYMKAYDDIRALFAQQPVAKMRGFKPGHFSFNVDGGRCEECQGEGIITVSMQFMADIHLTCKACKGKRFKEEILEITYRQKNIHDLLQTPLDQAYDFFKDTNHRTEQKIAAKIKPLVDVGLGYLNLGQPSSTLSGGEAQRIKLASFLINETKNNSTLFIFDEPTTGLHFYDIEKLLISFSELLKKGHSVVVIEHNIDVLKCADHIIDLGPEGGEKGGYVLFEGKPEDLISLKENATGQFLKAKMA